jgi:alpha-L-fucosidase 2
LDFTWSAGKVTDVELLSKAGETCRIKVGRPVTVMSQGKTVEVKELPGGVIEFATASGRSYTLLTR